MNCADAYFWRGRSERFLAEYDKARADFLTYKRLDPSDTVADGWIADLPEYQYDFDHKPKSEARQWAIALSAQMFSKNYEGIYSLPGQIPSEENITKEKNMLRDSWGIVSRETLLAQIERLLAAGHNGQWQMYRKIIANAPPGSKFSAAAGPQQSAADKRWAVVKEYCPTFGDRGIRGWDLVRAICLCRWGAKVGYITEDEAYAHMLPIARLVQKTYSGWNQMSSEYLIGRKFWDFRHLVKRQTSYGFNHQIFAYL